eukprot:1182253-Prorocentrum_minimum.AAC.1
MVALLIACASASWLAINESQAASFPANKWSEALPAKGTSDGSEAFTGRAERLCMAPADRLVFLQ